MELLSTEDKDELLAILDNGKRIVIDGWVYSNSIFYTSHKIGGAQETVSGGVKFPMPIYQWHKKKLFAASIEGQIATVRIIMSATRYDT